MYLYGPKTIEIDTIGTWYPIGGSWGGVYPESFRVESDGHLVYEGSQNIFVTIGTTNVSVSKACKLTYGVCINGEYLEGTQTPHDFTSAARTTNLAITGLAELIHGDSLHIGIKSDVANNNVTIDTLRFLMTEV